MTREAVTMIITIAMGVALGLFLYNRPAAIGRALLFIVAVIALASFFGHQ